jgi:hypothetical protein
MRTVRRTGSRFCGERSTKVQEFPIARGKKSAGEATGRARRLGGARAGARPQDERRRQRQASISPRHHRAGLETRTNYGTELDLRFRSLGALALPPTGREAEPPRLEPVAGDARQTVVADRFGAPAGWFFFCHLRRCALHRNL